MEDSDQKLARMLIEGGAQREQAVRALYTAYSGKFLRYFQRHGVHADAEDLVQQTFIKITEKCKTYRFDAPFGAWMWCVARNTMLDYFRSNGSRIITTGEQEPEDIETHVEQGTSPALKYCLKRQFEVFAKKYPEGAEALMRVAMDGWSYAELAAFLARSLGATRQFISEMRKHLEDFTRVCYEMH
ncbi:MAG: RNA polymerase sigma factor [Burkholderiales bacterium]